MANINFTTNLQRHIDAPSSSCSGNTVGELLERVFAMNPRLRGYILDEHGALRKHMLIFIDGVQILDRETLADPVEESSEVYVMQSLSGG